MSESTNIALSDSMLEDKKRDHIKKYFKKPKIKWAIILIIVGLLLLSSKLYFGLLLLFAGAGWLFYELKPVIDDKTIDTWLINDMSDLNKRSLERLNIDESELIRDSVVIRGPILWETSGIPDNELAWKKSKDKQIRFSINAMTIIHLTEHKLSSYQCDYNFIRGVPLNERDDEFHYRDVVAVSTRDDSTNYTLPNGSLMKQAQFFKLSVSSGDSIQVIVNSRELVDFTGGTISDTGIDEAIKALRKVLGEKKI